MWSSNLSCPHPQRGKSLFHSEIPKHKHSETLKYHFMNLQLYFWLQLKLKLAWWTDWLTLSSNTSLRHHELGRYHCSVTRDKQHEFWWKNKSCSKAIITFLGKEKHHLIKEHKTNTYDQRIKSERNTQREIFTSTE